MRERCDTYRADLRMRTAMTYATPIARSIPAERILGMLGGLFGLVALVVAGTRLCRRQAWNRRG
jgi:hypothetical protein